MTDRPALPKELENDLDIEIDNIFNIGMSCGSDFPSYSDDQIEEAKNDLKQVVAKFQLNQKQQLIEKLEGMKENNPHTWRFNEDVEMTRAAKYHNKAIDQVIKLLQEEG
jgi:hypothetical protein